MAHRVDASGAGPQAVALLALQAVPLQVVVLQSDPLPRQPLLLQQLQQYIAPPRPGTAAAAVAPAAGAGSAGAVWQGYRIRPVWQHRV